LFSVHRRCGKIGAGHRYFAFFESGGTRMKSHYETYKGWSVSVQVSAHLSAVEVDKQFDEYMPRVFVTEHLGGREFRDFEVIDGHSYPTREECIQRGIIAAHEYIDRKTGAPKKTLH